jgi:hypothetical protein
MGAKFVRRKIVEQVLKGAAVQSFARHGWQPSMVEA